MSREAAHGGCQKGAAGGLESFGRPNAGSAAQLLVLDSQALLERSELRKLGIW
jgi:hypothetical protein